MRGGRVTIRAAILFEGAAILFEGTAILSEGAAVLFDGAAILFEGRAILFEGSAILGEGRAWSLPHGTDPKIAFFHLKKRLYSLQIVFIHPKTAAEGAGPREDSSPRAAGGARGEPSINQSQWAELCGPCACGSGA